MLPVLVSREDESIQNAGEPSPAPSETESTETTESSHVSENCSPCRVSGPAHSMPRSRPKEGADRSQNNVFAPNPKAVSISNGLAVPSTNTSSMRIFDPLDVPPRPSNCSQTAPAPSSSAGNATEICSQVDAAAGKPPPNKSTSNNTPSNDARTINESAE